jgi:hypothetical protein
MPLGRGLGIRVGLADPGRYERQIERLHTRYLLSSLLYELQQDDVSLATVVLHRREVARLVAQTVARGEYELEPARVRSILVDGKEREVFALRLTDLIVHGAVNSLIEEALGEKLPVGVYSYRRGRCWWTAVADFAHYVRTHRRQRPDPKTRGLYVLRRDIEAYTDTIPVGDRSRLWDLLRETLASGAHADVLDEPHWQLIVRVVRPEAYVTPGREFTLWRGVPTGQPIACSMFNLYLEPLDRVLGAIPGGFYARYSDDILFAHPDVEVAQAADDTISTTVSALGLSLNPAKQRTLSLTAAGRPPVLWPQARAAMVVPFLGCRVAADGTVSLSRKKVRALLQELERRATQSVRAVPQRDIDSTGRMICAVVNRAMSGRLGPFQQRSAELLRRAVTDRRQLRQLDYWIPRIVLRAVTGDGTARAFRVVPYRTIRSRWRLTSLVHARDRQGRPMVRP